MQKYLVNTAGLDGATASKAMIAASIAFLLLQPLIGTLSDRIGRRTCLLIFSGGMTLLIAPLFGALGRVDGALEAFGLVFAGFVVLSLYTSVSGLFKAELFPASIRALGVGLGHTIASAIFGGTAEYIALMLKQKGHEELVLLVRRDDLPRVVPGRTHHARTAPSRAYGRLGSGPIDVRGAI